jgi:hypothetical protein
VDLFGHRLTQVGVASSARLAEFRCRRQSVRCCSAGKGRATDLTPAARPRRCQPLRLPLTGPFSCERAAAKWGGNGPSLILHAGAAGCPNKQRAKTEQISNSHLSGQSQI